MTTPGTQAGSSFDEFASHVLNFNPKGLWLTFLAIARSSWSDDEALADAIVNPERTRILSPFKYISGTFAGMLILLWGIAGLVQGEFGEIEGFSFLSPEILPMIIWPLVFAIPLHFVLGAGRNSGSQVTGFADGIWKIYALYMYMLGHFVFFFVPLMIGIMVGDSLSPELSIAVALAGGALGAFGFLYPMLFRAMPGTLAALYGVGRGRALFSVVALFMAMFAAHSLITTGQWPE